MILAIINGCGTNGNSKKYYYTNDEKYIYVYDTIRIDGCQYFTVSQYGSANMIVHKGNCNNPIHYEYENRKRLDAVDSEKVEYQNYLKLKQRFEKGN